MCSAQSPIWCWAPIRALGVTFQILPTPLGLTSPETDFCRCVCLSPVCPSRSHCGKGAGQRLFLLSWSYPTRFMFQAPPPCCAVSSRCARLFFTLLLQVLSAWTWRCLSSQPSFLVGKALAARSRLLAVRCSGRPQWALLCTNWRPCLKLLAT